METTACEGLRVNLNDKVEDLSVWKTNIMIKTCKEREANVRFSNSYTLNVEIAFAIDVMNLNVPYSARPTVVTFIHPKKSNRLAIFEPSSVIKQYQHLARAFSGLTSIDRTRHFIPSIPNPAQLMDPPVSEVVLFIVSSPLGMKANRKQNSFALLLKIQDATLQIRNTIKSSSKHKGTGRTKRWNKNVLEQGHTTTPVWRAIMEWFRPFETKYDTSPPPADVWQIFNFRRRIASIGPRTRCHSFPLMG